MNKKQTIRLNEGQLKRVVAEAVKRALNEESYIDGNVILSLELYRNDFGFGIWLSDNQGGSGIEASGNTPEEAAQDIAKYIADYFYKRDY